MVFTNDTKVFRFISSERMCLDKEGNKLIRLPYWQQHWIIRDIGGVLFVVMLIGRDFW